MKSKSTISKRLMKKYGGMDADELVSYMNENPGDFKAVYFLEHFRSEAFKSRVRRARQGFNSYNDHDRQAY